MKKEQIVRWLKTINRQLDPACRNDMGVLLARDKIRRMIRKLDRPKKLLNKKRK